MPINRPLFPSSLRPRATTATVTQQMIQRLIEVPADHSVQLSTDLGPDAMIVTFMIQNLLKNPFAVFLTDYPITRPADPSPCLEIVPGASPVFQVSSSSADATTVWDLTGYWLIGDYGFEGQVENITLNAFPLSI